MKQILEHFGGAIVVVIIASFLLMIFSGLQQDMGKLAESSFVDTRMGLGENQSFQNYKTTLKWDLSLKSDYDIKIGERYEVDSLLLAIDPYGKECEVWFASGCKENDPHVKMLCENGGKTVSCTSPGVYVVNVESYSPRGGYYQEPIRLLVNSEVTE